MATDAETDWAILGDRCTAIWCEMAERLESPLSEADAIAIHTAIDKVAHAAFRVGVAALVGKARERGADGFSAVIHDLDGGPVRDSDPWAERYAIDQGGDPE